MVIRDVPVARCHPEVQSGHTRENFYPGGWVEMMGSNNYLNFIRRPYYEPKCKLRQVSFWVVNHNAIGIEMTLISLEVGSKTTIGPFHFGWSIIMPSR